MPLNANHDETDNMSREGEEEIADAINASKADCHLCDARFGLLCQLIIEPANEKKEKKNGVMNYCTITRNLPFFTFLQK
jgi:hypothetical protein